MDDTQTFERRVATEVIQGMGPSEPVDDAAIFTAITTTRSPKWRFGSMFSATRFVVAGAVVALFGGFLLAGVLTHPSDESLPAAVADSTAPVEFTATVDWNLPVTDGGWRLSFVETSDPRIDGTLTVAPPLATGTYGDIEVTIEAPARIENADGAWREVTGAYGFELPAGVEEENREPREVPIKEREETVFVGEGAYDGFFIVVESTFDARRVEGDLHGYIVRGDLPVVPGPSTSD